MHQRSRIGKIGKEREVVRVITMSNQMKHTPGEWESIQLTEPMGNTWRSKFVIKSDKAPGGIAVTIGGLGEVEEEANARLIASAPELLGALKDMDTHFQAHFGDRVWRQSESALTIKLAIAKAEGRAS